MKIYKGEFDKKLELQIAPSVMAGFPSPAEEYFSETLDFNRDMIHHPESTFYGRVKGDSMIDVGIDKGRPSYQRKAKKWARIQPLLDRFVPRKE